ncbi:ead/Ea22-like family protein [Salmonella enterica]|uniref:ead/Ea22-like family protein n=1 Tax=Salmonella enterica TaxID=28901 RepID=UPI000B60E7E0|nr:ead/Ea22-like family protein [Salmonella enterica]ASD87117.1 addiction module toxin RelE [Salmonella enterica subsp. enterica serovar India str. SA20085604]EBW9463601.1 ead/Ea22-like family protein [Salmonella enterica subsp. enterica serovar Panama]EJC4647438.1 ead/Ea22-like family protein [Salmonella enterica]EKQ9927172.1 ead/Ea22-like family protein [Salmonella enterica subsp. enterica serovar Panama]
MTVESEIEIDKRALRHAAESVNSGDWSYEEFNDLSLPGGAYIKINGRDAIYCLKKPVGGVKQSRAVMAFIAAFNPKVALALLDENLQLQREKDAIEAVALAMRDDMRQAREQLEAAEKRNAEQREYYEGVIADGGKRIAELEKGHQEAAKQINSWRRLAKQNIAERGKDISELEAARQRIAEQSAIVAAAEKLVRCKGRYHSELNYRALAKLFGVITPDLPPLEHENVHYADAAEVEITALRQRIAELEARAVNLPKRSVGEVMHLSGFSRDYAEGWCAGNDNAIHEIRAAGIKVKEL